MPKPIAQIMYKIAEDLSHQPTQDMVDFFEKRTKGHIERVHANIKKILKKYPKIKYKYNHDASKFSEEERIPYIWYTEFFRGGKKLKYPPGMKKRIDEAINHHYKNNSHHTEYYGDASKMTRKDLIEMAADWGAMSQEKGSDLKVWANNFIKNHNFTDKQISFINELLDVLV